jgi:hypothetical protein
MKNPDHISESAQTIVFWLKFFDGDPGSGMEKFRVRDPGWKKSGSATLPLSWAILGSWFHPESFDSNQNFKN